MLTGTSGDGAEELPALRGGGRGRLGGNAGGLELGRTCRDTGDSELDGASRDAVNSGRPMTEYNQMSYFILIHRREEAQPNTNPNK